MIVKAAFMRFPFTFSAKLKVYDFPMGNLSRKKVAELEFCEKCKRKSHDCTLHTTKKLQQWCFYCNLYEIRHKWMVFFGNLPKTVEQNNYHFQTVLLNTNFILFCFKHNTFRADFRKILGISKMKSPYTVCKITAFVVWKCRKNF